MKKNYITKKLLGLCSATLVLQGVSGNPVQGQIVPDATLPSNSQVTRDGATFTIDGGTVRIRNHFHSFREFSIPTGTEAFFNNAATIENIITRVTGGEISNIDGLIRANGSANLFLLNPNGIIFGPNARLDIGGSFFGSTADSLLFDDGSIYSATSEASKPLLTINVPIGLQWNGQNQADIRVEGTGYNLTTEIIGLSPISGAGRSDRGLFVNPGKTLALVGGNISLVGGVLTAPGGRVELGAPARGKVEINPLSGSLNYGGVESFGDILLEGESLVDASGIGNGSIAVQGRSLFIRDGSLILMQNQGDRPSGSLAVNTINSLVVSGHNLEGNIQSGLRTESLATQQGAKIAIDTQSLLVENGGSIETRTYGQASAGNLEVRALESVELVGFFPANPRLVSLIGSTTFSSAETGEVTVETQRLTVRDGASVGSTVFGSGRGGDVTIDAANSVEIIGVNQLFVIPSSVSAMTFSTSNSGNVTINTSVLVIRDGATVSTSTIATGNAASVTVNATESVEVSGFAPGSILPSRIESGAIVTDRVIREALGFSGLPTGSAGNVTINTPLLRLNSSGIVTVRNDGEGNAGNLEVNANEIFLSSEGAITASTRDGNGGNIILQVPSQLQLTGGGQISAVAGGRGNGGNLTVNADTVVARGNSMITANAIEGTGGNISITANGIFLSSDSEITASSELGIDGTVTVSTPDVDPGSGLVEPPQNPLNIESLVGKDFCQVSYDSEFTITGRGGLPPNPNSYLTNNLVRVNWIDPVIPDNSVTSTSRHREMSGAIAPYLEESDRIVEATGWIQHPDGTIELVANPPDITSPGLKPVSCRDLR